jgi:hypothetical protein
VTWTSSGWCEASLIGKTIPRVLGKVDNCPALPTDSGKNRFQVALGPIVGVTQVYSNMSALTGGSWSVDLNTGVLTTTTAPAGKLTCDVLGESPFISALLLDGSTGDASATITAPTGARSLAAMVRIDELSTTTRYICGYQNSSLAGGFFLRIVAGNLPQVMAFSDTPTTYTAAGATALTPGRWYHIAGVLDTTATSLLLYVDGVLVATTTIAGAWTTALTAFRVGRRPDSATLYWLGAIDEVIIASRAMTITEVAALIVAPAVGTETYLRDLWHCDDRASTTVLNSMAGRTSLTMAGGATWTLGRCASADLGRMAYMAGGFASAEIDTSTLKTYIRAQPADCQCYVDDDRSHRDVVQHVVGGAGGLFGPDLLTGLIAFRRLEAPTGVAAAAWTANDLRQGEAIEPDNPRSPCYRVNVSCAANPSTFSATEIATIVQSNPTLYSFALEATRQGFREDLQVLADYSDALKLDVESPFYTLADGQAEAERLFTLLSVIRTPRRLPMYLSPYRNKPLDEVSLTWSRMGDSGGRTYLVFGIDLEQGRATVRVWR